MLEHFKDQELPVDFLLFDRQQDLDGNLAIVGNVSAKKDVGVSPSS